tara:strand:+ start:5184 stop:5729 length:546 start_codon:yes stop_codon:yes gene_type:complete
MRVTKISVLMVIGVLSFLPLPSHAAPVAIGAPPEECLVIGWTSDPSSKMNTMLHDNGVVIGDTLSLYSDCGEFLASIDGLPSQGGTSFMSFPITNGVHNITLTSEDDNWTVTFENVTFYPAGDVWVGDYPTDDTITISKSSLFYDEIIAHAITAIILFGMSTTVVYRFAQWRVDRTIEVIV